MAPRALKPILQRVGLYQKGTGLHAIRHTYVSLLIAASENIGYISDQVGHSTTKLTQDIYRHVFTKVRVDATHSFGCRFIEVTSQAEIARSSVTPAVTVIDAGRIRIRWPAGTDRGRSLRGSAWPCWSNTSYDGATGAPINHGLADYVVTVNASAPPIEGHFVDFPSMEINALDARGIGEIGVAGIDDATRPGCACANYR